MARTDEGFQMNRCDCGDEWCPRCYPDVVYQERRRYEDETVDYETDRLLNEWEESDD